ncbi:hypothetical protein MASR2M17_19310 [Aminivibrio sp.]
MVTLSWVIASVVGALPYYLYGTVPTFTDAFFEAISGFTTTGASVITVIESNPRGILFWRDLTHWLGGMGIIVLSLAILPFIGVGDAALQGGGPRPHPREDDPPHSADGPPLGVYVLLSAVRRPCSSSGMNLFESLTHTFGTMATGGFSPLNKSVASIIPLLRPGHHSLHVPRRGQLRPPLPVSPGALRRLLPGRGVPVYTGIVLFSTATVTAVLLLSGTYGTFAEALR